MAKKLAALFAGVQLFILILFNTFRYQPCFVTHSTHDSARHRPGLESRYPELVVIIPTAVRKGDNEGILIQTLDSLLNSLNNPEPIMNITTNKTILLDNSSEEPKILILVVNTDPFDQHSTFASAFGHDRFKNHPAIRFIQLPSVSEPKVQIFSGASVPIMSLQSHRYPVPIPKSLNYISRQFENPDGFLANWSDWPKEIFTKQPQRDQTADYLCAIHYSTVVFPQANILLWEDDCLFCPSVFPMIDAFQTTMSRKYPDYAILRMGYGASGLLINSNHLAALVSFTYAISFTSNVDVATHKYTSFHRLPHYITRTVYALHRGAVSTFGGGHDPRFLEMDCTSSLVAQWGKYGPCSDAAIAGLNIMCAAGYKY